MTEHPTTIFGFANIEDAAKHIESMNYAAQARLFGALASQYGERAAADDKAKRLVLGAKGSGMKTLALSMRDGLESMANVRPKKKKAA